MPTTSIKFEGKDSWKKAVKFVSSEECKKVIEVMLIYESNQQY